MIVSSLAQQRAVSQLAERQMRTWALQMQARQQMEQERAARPVPCLIHPYVAMSRETGVDAGELAHAVAKVCGWKVFDRELLDYLAEHDHLSRLALEFVDERTRSWFHEMFGTWLESQLISQAEYVVRLRRIVLLAAQHESTILVGRGVQFMLPAERGVAVRVVAPEKQRIQRIMKRSQLSRHEAEKFVHDTDRARAEFVQRYFHRDVADPHLYHLVINLEHVPRDVAVNLIVGECRRIANAAISESPTAATATKD
jgi:cytidylate kinase